MATYPILTDVTYAEFLALIEGSNLEPGLQYRITDFRTVYWMKDGDGEYIMTDDSVPEEIVITGDLEPLLVTATSANTIAREAQSELYPQDIIYYEWDINGWIPDSFNSLDVPEFYDVNLVEAVPNWKGAITHRNDTLRCISMSSDWRNVKYRLWNIEQPAWSSVVAYVQYDTVTYNNTIYSCLQANTDVEPEIDEGWKMYWIAGINIINNKYLSYSPDIFDLRGLNNNVVIQDVEDYIDRKVILDADTYSNNLIFEENKWVFNYMTFDLSCGTMSFGTGCNGMTFGLSCEGMIFGSGCSGMTFDLDCNRMTFGLGCGAMTFGLGCGAMSFGSDCETMTFGSGCGAMTFGSYCEVMTFGSDCGAMTFGSYCGAMSFGSYCETMTFGSYCETMTFGSYCETMTFGSDCGAMSFGSDCVAMSFPAWTAYNDFKDGVYNVDFTDSGIVQITTGITVTHQRANNGSAEVVQSYLDWDTDHYVMIYTTGVIGIII